MYDDKKLDDLLDANNIAIAPQCVWSVRRAILLSAASHPIRRHFIFGFHPAFAFATALFGLALGFSMPQVLQNDTSNSFFDISSQALDGGTFG
jgi:hypothetical protein